MVRTSQYCTRASVGVASRPVASGASTALPVCGAAVGGIGLLRPMRPQPQRWYWSRGADCWSTRMRGACRSSGCSVTTNCVRGQVSVCGRISAWALVGMAVGGFVLAVALSRTYSAERMASAGPETRGVRRAGSSAASPAASTVPRSVRTSSDCAWIVVAGGGATAGTGGGSACGSGAAQAARATAAIPTRSAARRRGWRIIGPPPRPGCRWCGSSRPRSEADPRRAARRPPGTRRASVPAGRSRSTSPARPAVPRAGRRRTGPPLWVR